MFYNRYCSTEGEDSNRLLSCRLQSTLAQTKQEVKGLAANTMCGRAAAVTAI